MVTDIQSCHVYQRKNQTKEGRVIILDPSPLSLFTRPSSISPFICRLSIQPYIHASIHYLSSVYLPIYLFISLSSFLSSTYLPICLPIIYLATYLLSVCLSVFYFFIFLMSICILNSLDYYLAQKQPGSGQWFREQNVPAQV